MLFHIHISHLYMDYEEDDDTSFAKWMSSFWGHNVADENERERRAYRKWQTRSLGERRASLPVRWWVEECEEEREKLEWARRVLEKEPYIVTCILLWLNICCAVFHHKLWIIQVKSRWLHAEKCPSCTSLQIQNNFDTTYLGLLNTIFFEKIQIVI